MTQDDRQWRDDGMFVTHFLVVSDQDRSRDFYHHVFGGTILRPRDPVILEVANTRLILDHGHEIRGYIRDPDGHLIEVGQATPTPSGQQQATQS